MDVVPTRTTERKSLAHCLLCGRRERYLLHAVYDLFHDVFVFSLFRILWIKVLRKKQKTSGANTYFDIFTFLYNWIWRYRVQSQKQRKVSSSFKKYFKISNKWKKAFLKMNFHLISLKVPQCEIFARSDFHNFYIISLYGWATLGLKYLLNILFFASFKFLRALWAFSWVPYAYDQCTHQFLRHIISMFEVTFAQCTHKFLMRMLQCTHQFLMSTYCTLQRHFRLYIPFLVIARPQPRFPH